MNFITTASTLNFVFTIISSSNGIMQVQVRPTTDDAKVFCKAKKISKVEPLSVNVADLGSKIESLENGVVALTALLAAA